MSMKVFALVLLILASNCSLIDNIIKKMKTFLQKKVDNEVIVQFMEIFKNRKNRIIPSHLAKNTEAFKNHINAIRANKGYIEDQKNHTDMSYGILHVSNTGCGAIATYNVLYHLTRNNNIDFASIVDDYENDGIVLYGLTGTSAKAIENYFKKNGFKTMSSIKEKDFD